MQASNFALQTSWARSSTASSLGVISRAARRAHRPPISLITSKRSANSDTSKRLTYAPRLGAILTS